ncbi:hypothetical protein Barb6XT_01353 [Bacteroidales bacterium Barb6XT]|nr:hypothetical protein Barb6XT_01353 [Bacteroidales bacterium Barb6XT]
MVKKIYLASFLMTFLFFVSCQEEGFILNENLEAKSAYEDIGIKSVSENGAIVEIEKNSSLVKFRAYSYGDDTGIDGIVGMPVNLVVKQNPFGKRYITYKGANVECKLEEASNGNDQKFLLRKIPLTGLFYFTPDNNPDYLLSAGAYANNPDVPVLYVKNSTNHLGAVWNIYKGQTDNTSFVLENEDLLEQGSGGFWDVYSLALGVNSNNGNLNFSKYFSGRRTQEFEIRPCDDFGVTEMVLSEYATSSVADIPDFVVTESYRNNGSSTQTMSTKIIKKAQNTSTFSRKTSLATNVNTSVKVGAFFASGSINLSVGTNQEWSYGGTETKGDDREYNFPLVIAPYKQINVSIIVTRKQATISYKAKLRGVTTGYEIWEEGIWENVDCTNIAVNLDEYDVYTGLKTGTRVLSGIPTSPTGIQ